ncbi:MAG: hypothetical protein HYX93_01860 [Chloroflexi bacterium]|nr:hypothetical protein [Chloroflexota bacterium]
MQKSSDPGGILSIPVGTRLRLEESAALEDLVGTFMDQTAEARGNAALAHNDLQKDIGQLLQQHGIDTSYAVPFADVGLAQGTGAFDIVGTMKEVLTIVEVYTDASEAALEVMDSHMTALRASNVHCKVFLAIDVMNGATLVSGGLRGTVKRLMTELDMGVILGDANFLVVCSNHQQLVLEEMPEFLFKRR